MIMLTEKALATLEPGRDALRSVDADVCAGFTDEERKVFLGLLRRMASNAEAALAQNI
jgi:DNA-binding MarR family transcriptional regulator